MIKNLIQYSIIVLLLFAGKISYGQIKIDSVTTDSVSCSLDSSACVTLYVSGFTEPFDVVVFGSNTFTSLDIPNSPVTFCGLAPGFTFVNVRSADGTQGDAWSDNIIATLPLDVSHKEDSVNCFGDTTGNIELDIKSGKGPFFITWSTGDTDMRTDTGTSILTGLTTGNYSYSVVDSTSGCTSEDTIRYEALDSILPSFTVSSSCVGIPLTITNTTFAKSNGTTTLNYSWDFPTGSPATATTEGPHDITYFTDGTKTISMEITSPICFVTYDTTITLQAPPIITTIGDTTICSGDTVLLTSSGGIDYVWSPTTELSSSIIESPLAFPTNTTQYVVAGSDADGCFGRDTVNVTTTPLPVLTLSNDTTICEGESVDLSATGAINYTWSPNSNITSINTPNTTVSPTTSTYYVVTGTNANGCASIDSILITVNQPPVISVSNDTTICFGDTAKLEVSGADTYLWTPSTDLSSATASAIDAFPTTTTTFVVEATALNGCISEDSILVSVRTMPVITTLEDTTICSGDTIELTSSGGINYIWSPNTDLSNATIESPLAFPTVTTQYVVAGSDADGCFGTDTVTVTTTPLPVLTLSPDETICEGDSIDLSATGAVNYIWSPNNNITNINTSTPTVSPIVSTYYSVIGTDGNGCSTTDSVLITVIQPSVITVSNDTTICFGDTAMLEVSGAVNYIWTPSSELSSATAAMADAFPTTTTTFIVEGISLNGCIAEDSVTVSVRTLPIITTLEDTTICSGDTITLTTSGGINYIWTPSTNLSDATIESPLAFPTSTIQYIVSGSDIDVCIGTDSVTITTNPLPVLTLSPDETICEGESVNLSVSGAQSYVWSPNNNITNINAPNPTVSPTVSTYYHVTGTNGNGCSATDSVLITVIQASIISPSNDTTICLGDTAVLTVNGAQTYTWSPSGELSSATASTVNAFPTTTTTFVVEAISANGCISKDSVEIAVAPLPVASVTGADTICVGDSVQLIANGGTGYSWNNASTLSDASISNPFAKPLATTTYTVEVSDGTCTDEASVIVSVLDNSLAAVSNDTTICSGNPIQLNASGGNVYSWAPVTTLNSPNIANPIATPDVNTEYVVQISVDGRCFIFDTIQVTVNQTPVPVTIGDTSICSGDTIDLFTSDGLSYTWTPTTGLVSPNTAITQASPITTTSYSVLVDNNNSCSVTETVNVTVNPAVTAGLTISEDTICFLDTLQLTASGGTSYTWFPNNIILSPGNAITEAVPTKDTTITVLVEGAGGCSDSAQVSVVVLTPPSLTASNDTLVCSGDTIQLSASGGIDYQWIPNTNIIDDRVASPFVFPKFTTFYVVRASTGGLCPAVDSVLVEVFDRPDLGEVNDTTICEGSSLSLNFTTPGTYNWTPLTEVDVTTPNNPIFSPTVDRTYFLAFSDGNACAVFDTINIMTSPVPVSEIDGDSILCIGEDLILNAVNTSDNYSWVINGTEVSITQNLTLSGLTQDTTVSLTVENSFGCSTTDVVTVEVFNFPSLNLPSDTLICGKDTVDLILDPTYTYSWSPVLEMTGELTNTPSFFPSFTRQYTVNVTDGLCATSDTFLITTEALPIVSIITKDSVCFSDTILLIGQGGISRSWNIDGTIFNTDSVELVANNDLKAILTATSANSCQDLDSAFVTVDDSLGLEIIAPNAICNDREIYIKTNTLNIDSLYWINVDSTTSASDSILFTISSDSLIQLRAFNDFGCMVEGSTTIIAEPLPQFDILGNDSICLGETSSLSIVENFTYTWSGSNDLTVTSNNTADFNGSVTDTIFVDAISTIGCQSTDSLIIVISTFPTDFLPALDSVCLGDSLTYTGDSAFTYSSSSLNQIQTDDTTFVTFPTTNQFLTVEITNGSNCTTKDSVQILVNDLPTIVLPNNFFSCENVVDSIRASSPNAISYSWSPVIGLSHPNSSTTGVNTAILQTYTLNVIDNKGCGNSGSVLVKPLPLPILITSGDTAICMGETAPISVSGADSYVWLDPTKVDNANVDNTLFIGNTTSILQVVGRLGSCTDTASINIIVNELPTGSLTTLDDTLCYNELLSANGNLLTGINHPDGSYSFDNGNTFMASNNLSTIPENDTTITLILRDAIGCLSNPITLPFVVYDQLFVQIDTISFPDCVGMPGEFNASNFSGGTSPYKYNFNSNDTLDYTAPDVLNFANLTQGQYSFYIEDANLCSERFDINFLSSINFDTTITDVTCHADNDGRISIHTITGGQEPYEFGFGQNTSFTEDSIYSNLDGGIYRIYIKDQTNCIVQADLVINEPDTLMANITLLKNVTCIGLDNGEIGLEIIGGNPDYTIDGLNTSVVSSRIQFYTGLAAQTDKLIITDSKNCKDSVDIVIDAAEIYETTVSQIGFGRCTNDILSAQIDQTIGGSGINVYSLDFGTVFKSFSETSSDLLGISSGIYTIITSDTILGCIDTTEFSIVSNDGLIVDSVVITPTAPSCAGNDGELSITNLQGGLQPFSFSLLDSAFITISHPAQLDSSFMGLSSGVKGIRITDDMNCEYLFTSMITGPTPLDTSFDVTNKDCSINNGSITFNALGGSGSYRIAFDTANPFPTNTIENLDSGMYTVYYYDESNKAACLDSTIISIRNFTPELEITISNSICSYDSTGTVTIDNILNQSAEYSYIFSIDSTKEFIDTNTFNNLASRNHSIDLRQTRISTGDTCTYTASLHYDTIVSPIFPVNGADSIKTETTIVPDGKESSNTGSFWVHTITGGTSPYSVSFENMSNFITYSNLDSLDTRFNELSNGTYTAYVKDSNDCILEIIDTVDAEFNIPNIFTPNGDGLNEVFTINNLPESSVLRVYDRWGALIYMKRDYDNSWDGGKQSDGTYFYEFKTPKYTVKGWVQIVR